MTLLRYWSGIAGAISCSCILSFSLSVNAADPPAKPQSLDRFSNPLELTTPDPLLPGGLTRPLSEAEKQTLRTALDRLDTEASAKLQSGDPSGAFDIWNRELRLRRALGLLEEVQALGRVGNIAWVQNQPKQVRFITNRLSAIQTQILQPSKDQPVSPDRAQILPALGVAFQQVRSPGLALQVYQQLLAEARARQDAAAELNLLNTIGQLHLSWFDYPNAIATYTELLNLAKARNNSQNITANLAQLAYIAEQAKQPTQAIAYEQQLIDLYQRDPQQARLIPPLKLRQADNYAVINDLGSAEKAYRETYELATPLLQYAYASDALRKLGALYRSNDRLDAALQVYQYLAEVQQRSYDAFGIMDAYDQIGQIQLQRRAFSEAARAFRQGLEVAKQINYRVDYFTEQLQKIQASR